jgi:hypothetical protein
MVIGKTIDGSFIYAKDGLVGKWEQWILLIISCIIFPLFMGYTMRIYRGANPAPALDDWGNMFIDGIKLLIVGVIYALPIIFLDIVLMGSTFLALLSSVKTTQGAMYMSMDPGAVMGLLVAIFFGAMIIVIVAIIIGLITATASVRFARTGSFGEAFNFGAIFAHIGKIGWMTYIIALLMLGIIVGIVEVICMVIPYIGIVLLLILLPFISLFSARYLTMLYESAGPE